MEKKTTAAKPVVKTTEKEASKSAVKETAAVKSAPAKESVKETGTDDKMIIYTTDLEQKDNIINFLVVTLKLNRIVFETRYLKNIPRSETGKVLYAELPIK